MIECVRTAIIAASFALAFATGCEKEGPAERAGRNVDEAFEDVSDAVDDAGEKARRAVN